MTDQTDQTETARRGAAGAESLPSSPWWSPTRQSVLCVVASTAVLALGVGGIAGYRWFIGGDSPVLAGVVVDADGAPMDGVPVTAYLVDVDELGLSDDAEDEADETQPDDDLETDRRFRVGGATTGADGSFAVSGGIPRYAPVGDHRGPVELVVTIGSNLRSVEVEAVPDWDGDGAWVWPDDPALVAIDDERLDPSLAGRPLVDLRLPVGAGR